ncbi:hypothetical protein AB0F20_26025 [Streptomyces goshikiensis]|uniref:hypothetical protein n=1 Tax=Streptomyces goshikiensis TaxID=1942 RepID=UPI0033CDE817
MTTPWPTRRTARRLLPPRVAARREPVDPARIGRRVVRRQAKGMDAGAVAAALEEARFDARQASRYEDLADEVRGPAELAEWERIAALLAAAGPGTVYDPDVDDVVQAELAADAAAAAAREAELREVVRIAARANHLQVLRDLGTLDQAEPAEGDEAVRDELTRRAGGYIQADVDAWLAHALAPLEPSRRGIRAERVDDDREERGHLLRARGPAVGGQAEAVAQLLGEVEAEVVGHTRRRTASPGAGGSGARSSLPGTPVRAVLPAALGSAARPAVRRCPLFWRTRTRRFPW